MGLANNTEFTVERYNPSITATSIDEERAAFDPTFRAEASRTRSRSSTESVTQGFQAFSGVSRSDPLGTKMEAGVATSWSESLPSKKVSDDAWKSSAAISVTQALLKGAGAPVNLATLRKACLSAMGSRYQVQAKAESLAADIESKYWDYYLAEGQVDIYSRSLKHAKRLVRETRDRIALGERASTEIYFAEAEAATREQNLLNARSFLEKTRLRLLRLMNPPGACLWNRKIKALTDPRSVKDRLDDPRVHIQLALKMRPDLNQARLEVEKGNLDVIKTKNGLLPKLDLFMTLGRAGFGRIFTESPKEFLHGTGGLDFIAGARTEFPPLNRAARAQYTRSLLSLAQQKEALTNLAQVIEEEILSSYVEVERAREQIDLSVKTVGFQKEKVAAEEEKYRLGKSAMFQVAQAQRDLVLSELTELQARIDFVKGLTQFYLAEGSLLLRRGIAAPSGRP
jgi:outer membrane protein TolC